MKYLLYLKIFFYLTYLKNDFQGMHTIVKTYSYVKFKNKIKLKKKK